MRLRAPKHPGLLHLRVASVWFGTHVGGGFASATKSSSSNTASLSPFFPWVTGSRRNAFFSASTARIPSAPCIPTADGSSV